MNVVGSKTNWYTFLCTTALFFSGIVFFVFITFFFDWLSLVLALVFAFIIMGTQQTIWHHRYATHHAYKIKYNWVKIFIRNMVPRFLLEEVYVFSHYVHHALSDEPGDPYNAKGGFWYCMLSEENHQAPLEIYLRTTTREFGIYWFIRGSIRIPMKNIKSGTL